MLALDLQKNPEEVANTLTHGAGAVASAIAGTALVAMAALGGDRWQLLGALVYACALVAVYASSTLYHWEADPVAKARLELVDHCAIFGLIAGTYTPFMLVTLRDGIGLPLLGVIWALAAGGVAGKIIFGTGFRIASTLLYLAMGWLIVVAAAPMLAALPALATALLVAGGLSYTVGTYFFCDERIPYCHAIWHLFVLAGSACHFVAVATQVLPR
jgi:hemolysin III